ncbi:MULTISPECIES: hypothetical protein [unclassified Xanthobacter]|uniref:hypothetical protein n=1 Tax=unclassified Xanthobacter TaxID=2623496 RepID=UPI001EDF7210|nr:MULTISPECIES: hypothetical protein [unclassified Xanthobacter]
MSEFILVRVAHQTVGRTRLVALSPLDGSTLAACATRVNASGLARAEARPRSNGLILTHAGPWQAVADSLHAAGLRLPAGAELAPAPVGAAPPARTPRRPAGHPIGAAYDAFARSNAAVAEASGGRLDITNAAFLLLVASGMVQLMRGQIAGPALSLFSQALTLAVLHGKAAPR